jgi:hypothetical protein
VDLADILMLALADATAQARVDLPEAFARVDAIKAGPRVDAKVGFTGYDIDKFVHECRWCGADFIGTPPSAKPTPFCSRSCAVTFHHWEQRRARAS